MCDGLPLLERVVPLVLQRGSRAKPDAEVLAIVGDVDAFPLGNETVDPAAEELGEAVILARGQDLDAPLAREG